MLMVKLKLSYCYNYIKLVNGKVKIKLLLRLHSNIELIIEHDLRLDMCFPYTSDKGWGQEKWVSDQILWPLYNINCCLENCASNLVKLVLYQAVPPPSVAFLVIFPT